MARPPSPRAMLLRYLVGNQVQQAIHVAARLRIADALTSGPMRTDDLADAVNAKAPALRRLLRTLAAFGIFEARDEDAFSLNHAAALLRDGPESLRPFALWSGGVSYQAFGDLEHSVRTGEPAFEHLFAADFFDYLVQHGDVGDQFDDMMSWNTRPLCPALASRDYSAVRTIVDLGGGRGDLLAAILAAHAHLHGVLVDRRLTSSARETLARAGVDGRCTIIAGDVRDEVPDGGDVYLLKNVLHGLDDVGARRVLENCRRAMHTDATLLVIELFLPDGSDQSPARLMDLLMLVGCHGRERRRAEFETLLAAAGFDGVDIRPAGQAFQLIEAHPAPVAAFTR